MCTVTSVRSRSPRRATRVPRGGSRREIARIIEPHVKRVIVVSPSDTGIRHARAKTDRLDARTLAKLLAAGTLDSVWMPDERRRVMRRRVSRRSQLVEARTRVKNEIHAILIRRLKGRPEVSDLFGKAGRAWLGELELPVRGARDARQWSAPDRLPRRRGRVRGPRDRPRRAQLAPGAPADDRPGRQRNRHEHLPGRRREHRALPRPAQAGRLPRPGPQGPPVRRHTRHARAHLQQGAAAVRVALFEASWSAVRRPGPLRAFYRRVRARRGHQIAITATARKLASLFWVLLRRQEDYAFGQPSLTAKKLRRLEITAGAPRWQDRKGVWIAHRPLRDAELDLARQAEQAYAQTIRDRQAAGAKTGASATPGRASQQPTEGKAARQTTSP